MLIRIAEILKNTLSFDSRNLRVKRGWPGKEIEIRTNAGRFGIQCWLASRRIGVKNMRKDINEICSVQLSQAIKNNVPERRPEFERQIDQIVGNDRVDRVDMRRQLIEPAEKDPNALERVLGISDLCSINFLTRGFEAATSVARVRVREPSGAAEWFGTGFMVAPGLLMTNHHVIPNAESAALAIAEFDYQHDVHGVEMSRHAYNLMPSSLFFTDSSLDFTIVEIAPRSFNGMPLSEYGYLPLIPNSGKALDPEKVSIIQHPGGQPKQIAIRDSRIIVLSDEDLKFVDSVRFIHYSTDTEPGSSGAPVLNDQWQVVALHHRAVPNYNESGERLALDGITVWNEEMGLAQRGWVANQGVRISAIYAFLEERRFNSPEAGAGLNRLKFGLSMGRHRVFSIIESPEIDEEFEAQGADSKPTKFKNAKGYDKGFLSETVKLPKDDTRKTHQAKLTGKTTTELRYTHFSVVFDLDRRFARFTAVNIDGNKLKRNSKVKTSWHRDARIDVEIQPDDDFYKKSVADENVFFQRGHLVRRVDPSWGSAAESKRAVLDTFHFTNAAPHQATFNNSLWGDLEDYLLVKCDTTEKRMTVFSGPVFRETDPKNYGINRPKGPYTIPVEYWKVAVLQKTSTKIAAAGFMVGHGKLLDPLTGSEKVFSGLSPYTPAELVDNGIQTTIQSIENVTGLNFGTLKNFDTVAGLESTHHSRRLRSAADIVI